MSSVAEQWKSITAAVSDAFSDAQKWLVTFFKQIDTYEIIAVAAIILGVILIILGIILM